MSYCLAIPLYSMQAETFIVLSDTNAVRFFLNISFTCYSVDTNYVYLPLKPVWTDTMIKNLNVETSKK